MLWPHISLHFWREQVTSWRGPLQQCRVRGLSCKPNFYVSWSTSEQRVRLERSETGLSPPVKYFHWLFQGGASFVDHLCYFCLVFVMLSCTSVYWWLLVTCWERVCIKNNLFQCTVKPGFSGRSKRTIKLVFNINYCSIRSKVLQNAPMGAFCNTFDLQ